MDNHQIKTGKSGTATVILLSFLLFYLPSVIALFSHGDEPWSWTLLSIIMATFYTAVFCINYFKLVPMVLFRSDRKVLFFLLNFLIIAVICCLTPLCFERLGAFPRPKHLIGQEMTIMQHLMGYFRFVIRDGIMMILAASLAYALRLSRERENVRRRELEVNAERKQIELKSLKAQLNPHFLFNSLNNIYALIAISPDRAQEALHDLSSMLRFMIYDAASALVPLSKELRFIADYVELMKLRLNSSIRLECNIIEPSSEEMKIAPLLFLTLVENAFKHSTANDDGWFISINITSDKEWLSCCVANSCLKNNSNRMIEGEESGVGLMNVEQQLRLIYPGQHIFSLSETDGVYSATIKISIGALLNPSPSLRKQCGDAV